MTHSFFLTLVQAIAAVLGGIGLARFLRHVMDRCVEIDPDDRVNELLNKIFNHEETETNILF